MGRCAVGGAEQSWQAYIGLLHELHYAMAEIQLIYVVMFDIDEQ